MISNNCRWIGIYPKIKRSTSKLVQQLPMRTIKTGKKEIVVPKRIERDEFTVLKALASTVKKDVNGPAYRYIDDPYLIPGSISQKRIFSLAKASGKKTAQYVVKTYPDLFAHNPAEPPIEAFLPPLAPKNPEDTEEGLKERISLRMTTDAYNSYQKVKEKGQAVSMATLNDLLDLLCVYNSQDPKPTLTPEEQIYIRDIKNERFKPLTCTWKDNGPAEIVFGEIGEPNARAYSSMIRGFAKYYQAEKASNFLEEMKGKKFPVDVKTYNAVISLAPLLRTSYDDTWTILMERLSEMRNAGVRPNSETFNTSLWVLTSVSKSRNAQKWARLVVNEMRAMGIEPTLATFHYLIKISYIVEASNLQSNILYDIVDYLKDKNLQATAPDDYDFFAIAMEKCCYCLHDLSLAYKISSLLHYGNNIRLIGDTQREGMYYTAYLRLLCMFEQIDKIMKEYDKIVPHSYVPTPSGVEDLLKTVDLNKAYTFLPKLWADIVTFGYERKESLLESLLAIMAKKSHEEKLQKRFVEIAQSIRESCEMDVGREGDVMDTVKLTSPMISSMVLICLHANQPEKAWEYFEIYRVAKARMSGFISEECLTKLTEEYMRCKDVVKVMELLQTLAQFSYPSLTKYSERAKKELSLSKEQIHLIDGLD